MIKDAIILGGGFGTRLRPVVDDRPKPLALIDGVPFIVLILEQLIDAGVRNIVISTGYMAEKYHSILGYSYKGANIIYSHEEDPLGTGGAFNKAQQIIRSDTFFAMNGDDFVDLDFKEYAEWFFSKEKYKGSILVTEKDDCSSYGTVKFDRRNSRIKSFEEKGAQKGPGYISTGIYILTKELFASVPDREKFSIEYDCFPNWVSKGLVAKTYIGPFIDIGTPESYKEMQEWLEKNG